MKKLLFFLFTLSLTINSTIAQLVNFTNVSFTSQVIEPVTGPLNNDYNGYVYNEGKSAFADIDNDGDMDMAFLEYHNPIQLHILMNGGNGNFSSVQDITLSTNVRKKLFIKFLDFDNDGDLDLFVGSQKYVDPNDVNTPLQTYMEIYENDGNNHFTLSYSDHDEDCKMTFRLADINHDNYIDIITMKNDGNISYALNNQNGGFDSSLTDVGFVSDIDFFEVVDFDNDGYADICVHNNTGYKLLLNNQNLAFTEHPLLGVTTEGGIFRITDLNNDNNLELIVFGQQKLQIFKHLGNYIFTNVYEFENVEEFEMTGNVKIADMNNDGKKDIIYQDELYNSFLFTNQNNFNFKVKLLPQIVIKSTYGKHSEINVADVTGDGYKDILVSRLNEYNKFVINLNGEKFVTNGKRQAVYDPKGHILSADIDGDNLADLVTFYYNEYDYSKIIIYKNNGNGYDPIPISIIPYQAYWHPSLFDADNDGDNDLIFLTDAGNYFKFIYYSNDGEGNFIRQLNGLPIDNNIIKYAIGDFNGDGYKDIIVQQANNIGFNIYLNQQGTFSLYQSAQIDNSPTYDDFFVIDVNHDGISDIVYGNKIFINDGSGNFTLSQTLNDNYKRIYPIDLNSDGYKDFIYVNFDSNSSGYLKNKVYMNDGDGTGHFSLSSNLSGKNIFDSDWTYRYFVLDFDNDGDEDLFLSDEHSQSSSTLIFYQNINGTLYKTNDTWFDSPMYWRQSIIFLDYNQDGWQDYISRGYYSWNTTYDFGLSLKLNQGYTQGVPVLLEFPNFKTCIAPDSNTLDLNDITNIKLTNLLPANISYYNTLDDAENQQNEINNLITNVQIGYPYYTIFARLTYSNQDYIFKFVFEVDHRPVLEVASPSVVPDPDGDGVESVDLFDFVTEHEPYANLNFYPSYQDALAQTNSTRTVDIYTGLNTFWARNDDACPNCCNCINIKQMDIILDEPTNNYDYSIQRSAYQLYDLPQITNLSITSDDKYSGKIDIDFNFNFFGYNYQKIVIGSNGNVSFNKSDSNQYAPYQVQYPIPDDHMPTNSIFGIYQDYDVANDNIGYQTIGTAPFRKKVVYYNQLPLYNCSTLTATSQISLLESYNIIDVNVKHREPCNNWQNGNGILGVQDKGAINGFTPPDRNLGNWTADNETWCFKPTYLAPDFQYIICDANVDGQEDFDLNIIRNHYATANTVDFFETKYYAKNNINPFTANTFTNTKNAQMLYAKLNNGSNFEVKRILLAAIDCNADYDFDTVPTATEDLNNNDNYGDDDTDGDGLPDFIDEDDDGDMILTIDELTVPRPNNRTVNTYADTDGDGIPNYLDDDDDGDGTLTIDEDYNGDGNPGNDDINNNGIPDYLDYQVTANVTLLPDSAIHIYPIPSKNILHVDFNIEVNNATMKLYTQEGKIIQEKLLNKIYNIINLPPTTGVYYLKLITDKGVLYKSIIKK